MGYHLTTADDVETRAFLPPARSAKYTLCHRKPTRGPIFKWVLSTKYTDEESGLLYYGYRYYSSQLGRWVSRDPLGDRGGINIYVLVRNQSISQFDRLGLSPSAGVVEEITAGLLAFIGGGLFLDDIILAIYGRDKFISDTHDQLTARGPLSGMMWQRAVDSATGTPGGWGATLNITEANQGTWANAVDKIKATSTYQDRVTFIKERIHAGTAPIGWINIEFNDPEELRSSIHGAQLHYSCKKCVLNLTITDDYNFDKKHMWRELQEDGNIMPYSVFIVMPKDTCDRP